MLTILHFEETMGKVIEVYVKNSEVPVGIEHGYYLISPGHECTRTPVTAAVMEKVLPEADRNVLELLQVIAQQKQLKVRVYNISTLRGKLRAQLRGVKKTPTIIFRDHRIDDAITKEKLLSVL